MTRSKRFMDTSRPRSQQQSSSSLLSDAPLEDIFPNQDQTQDNEIPHEQTHDSETQEQNEELKDLQSSSKKKTRTAWEVDVINEVGIVKKKKLKVKEVWTVPSGEQIVVPFDNFGTPFTEAAGLFTGTLAGLAQESNSFPINFTDWRLMPKQYKEDIFTKVIKPKFHFQNEVVAKHWTLQNIGRKWKDFKSRLWIEFYDPSLNRDELISKCPIGIQRDQWSSFVNYRLSEKSKEMCRKNAESRKHQKIAHTCGSKSFARRSAEMEIELGHNVNRLELWVDTHKVKRGSVVNEECRNIIEKFGNEMDQGSSSQSQSVSQDDPLAKVFGKEHPGRVRGLGFGPCPSKIFNNTPRMNEMSSHDNQMKEYVSNLEKELVATKAQL